ncbi:MAG TPA: carboxypeptidase-like regulatory domain-containing protein [Amycolatopsis sp.]|nr:carboxypeptidase-like regulatory domain-containing protein [Amycolatopsis sp.]HKS45946.1 carboxypeptidase-like regulatory domain-containing protein [Amycolatopsis sp.]
MDGTQVARAKADPATGYLVGDLAPGTYTLVVTAPGFGPEAAAVSVNGFGAVRDFLVRGGEPVAATLCGTVSGPGRRPVPGATVTVTGPGGDPAAQAVSGPDGRYEIPGLAPGEYTLVTNLYEPAVRRVELGSGESATVDVDLAGSREDARS